MAALVAAAAAAASASAATVAATGFKTQANEVSDPDPEYKIDTEDEAAPAASE